MSRNTVSSTTAVAERLERVTAPLYRSLPGQGKDTMPPSYRFQPRCQPLEGEAGRLLLREALVRLAPLVRRPVLFDGAAGASWSLLAFDPLPLRAPRSLRGLRPFLRRLERAAGDPVVGPFEGGFCGALAYELGSAAERGLVLPSDPLGFPRLCGGLYTDFLVRDERAGRTVLVLGEDPGDGRPGASQRARRLREALARERPLEPLVALAPPVRLVTRAEHCSRIARARELIAAGEIYQANLSHRLTCPVRGDPLDLYLRLLRLHPAPCAGYARLSRGALLSASPELLLETGQDEAGAWARTRPIKGTSARCADPESDAESARRLLSSAKDRAELAMIVDLERNDLGRIARPGSVEVRGFPSLESLVTVHHLTAEVVARPRQGIDALDVLAALFPGGSVTGAPKLRSMEVIAELEGEGRGFAYGSLAFLDTRGRLWASLLIRTLLWRSGAGAAGQVSFRVGGGITYGSEPEAEDDESLAKGAALARALVEDSGARAGGWHPPGADALL
jgi:para-aminobenzoate synthetase component 1